jgi:hypothetical protein
MGKGVAVKDDTQWGALGLKDVSLLLLCCLSCVVLSQKIARTGLCVHVDRHRWSAADGAEREDRFHRRPARTRAHQGDQDDACRSRQSWQHLLHELDRPNADSRSGTASIVTQVSFLLCSPKTR